MRKVILFGTSSGAQLLHFAMSQDPGYEVVAFTVDRAFLKEPTFRGLPVVAFEEVQDLYPPSECSMLVAVFANGMNKLRAAKCEEAKAKGYTLASYVHPTAIVASDLVMGENCYIGEGVVCRPFSKLGNDVFLMPSAYIGHDSEVGDHSYIGVRAVVMGCVKLGPHCFIGPNATILQELVVGAECLIGGGVVLQANAEDKSVYKAPVPIKLPLPSDKLARLLIRSRT